MSILGCRERYLTAGTVNINELLKGIKGDFLGKVDGIGMEDLRLIMWIIKQELVWHHFNITRDTHFYATNRPS